MALGSIDLVECLCNPSVVSEPGANGQTPLYCAVGRNDPNMVQCLLERGADVNDSQSKGPSPLIEALLRRNYAVVDILLDWGANVEATDDQDWRPLHYVSAQGHQQLTRRLMDAGCISEAQNDQGETPLFLACNYNHTEIIDLFFARGIGNARLQSSAGSTYAHIAAYRGSHEVLEKLILMDRKLIFAIDWAGFAPLCIAAYRVHSSIVNLLLAYGASPDGPPHTHTTPLGLAAAEGSMEIVEALLRAGAEVDKTGPLRRTPLMSAVGFGCVRTTLHLLQAGANPFLRDDSVSFRKVFAHIKHLVSIVLDILCT